MIHYLLSVIGITARVSAAVEAYFLLIATDLLYRKVRATLFAISILLFRRLISCKVVWSIDCR